MSVEQQTDSPPRQNGVARVVLPFAVLLIFGLWLTSPLWRHAPLVFTRELFVDGVMGAWFYDYVGRSLAEGHLPHSFGPFDWPCSRDALSLPNLWDAILASPLTFFLDWPTQWGAQMAMMILSTGLAVAWLARAIGCRGLPVAFAGAMAMIAMPMWHEVQAGRINGAWLALPFAAVAAYVDLSRWALRTATARGGERLSGLLLFVLACGFGAATLAVYPPYAVMLAPAAIIFIFPTITRGLRPLTFVIAAVGVGFILALPELERLFTFLDHFYKSSHSCEGTLTPCPYDNGHAYLLSLVQVRPLDGIDVFIHSTAPLSAWILLPTLILARGWRGYFIPLLMWIAALAALSLGPCPVVDPPQWFNEIRMVELPSWRHTMWCELWDIHRMERFLMPALMLTAVVSARGLEGMRRIWPTWGGRAAAALAIACVAHGSWLLWDDLMKAHNWTEAAQPTVVAHIKGQAPMVLAVLPFDGSQQFLTDLEAPGHRYVNPFELDRQILSPDPLGSWLLDVGRWEMSAPPEAADFTLTGIDRVYYDRGRCRSSNSPDIRLCERDLPALLSRALGEGQEGDGLMWWDLHPAQGVAAAMEAQCPL